MIYHKVLPQYDNKVRYKWRRGQGVPDSILVANELYTEAEFKKIANCPAWFEQVEIPKNKTYWCFGARFEAKLA